MIGLKAESRGQSQQGFFSARGKGCCASLPQWWFQSPSDVLQGMQPRLRCLRMEYLWANPSLVILFHVILEWDSKREYADTLTTVQTRDCMAVPQETVSKLW